MSIRGTLDGEPAFSPEGKDQRDMGSWGLCKAVGGCHEEGLVWRDEGWEGGAVD